MANFTFKITSYNTAFTRQTSSCEITVSADSEERARKMLKPHLQFTTRTELLCTSCPGEAPIIDEEFSPYVIQGEREHPLYINVEKNGEWTLRDITQPIDEENCMGFGNLNPDGTVDLFELADPNHLRIPEEMGEHDIRYSAKLITPYWAASSSGEMIIQGLTFDPICEKITYCNEDGNFVTEKLEPAPELAVIGINGRGMKAELWNQCKVHGNKIVRESDGKTVGVLRELDDFENTWEEITYGTRKPF